MREATAILYDYSVLGTEWAQLLSSRPIPALLCRDLFLGRLFWMLKDLGETTNPEAKKLLKNTKGTQSSCYKELLISLNDRAC